QLVTTWGSPQVGIEIFTAEELARESESLAAKARLPLVETPHATPSERRVEDRAMVIHAVAPVHDPNGVVVALLDGGVVLNNSFGLVDGIRNLVYAPESLPKGSSGAVTVFLDDVRISTNVPLRAGERALGTRVSDEVREIVLERGNNWVDYAFVVNDWYVSAYEPILDVNGNRVGMLHTGFLEAPFRHTYYETLGFALLLLLLCATFAAFIVVRGARAIFQPIESIAAVVRDIRKGEDRRVGQLAKDDEIGELAGQLDETLNLLKLRNDEIRQAAARLETKVDERTRELRDKNLRLEETIAQLRATRAQLVAAEKLAALGELTAGVAHEINNPIAVIQGNLEVLRRILDEQAVGVDVEVDLIMEQVERIHAIVDKLLRYSRASTYEAELEQVDMQSIIEDTLVLTEHETSTKAIEVETRHEATNRVYIDRHELQQVLVNLLVNAAQASSYGGRIEISSANWNADGVAIAVRDEGSGIRAEHLARVFDPFFTTKKVGGTGLGLSVSYGIIRRYGGDIKVTSEEGRGALFEVHLPRNSAFARDARRVAPDDDSLRPAATPDGDINERRYL
ncbi:MAG: cache domain-containing protein, partial [Gammaproteobacteria bacterium]|nr:cache domain-containing protein [Gammaproteobacteria bacterium]